jgi:hypothetical protein
LRERLGERVKERKEKVRNRETKYGDKVYGFYQEDEQLFA